MNTWFAGLLGGLFLLGSAQIRAFEDRAARDVASRLNGENKQVSVRVRLAGVSGALASATVKASNFQIDGLPLRVEPERSTRGRLHELRLDMSDFFLRGLRVESFRAKLPDCRFDYSAAVRRGQIRLSRTKTGTGEVVVNEADLAAYLLRKQPAIKRAAVSVKDGRLSVTGYAEMMFVKSDFSVDAALGAREGVQLVLEDAKIRLGDHEASDEFSAALLRLLNPVVDLDKDLHLEGSMQVQKLLLSSGRVTATGTVSLPDSKPDP